jgi:diguanylate cyclase (GGDEF)-like protein
MILDDDRYGPPHPASLLGLCRPASRRLRLARRRHRLRAELFPLLPGPDRDRGLGRRRRTRTHLLGCKRRRLGARRNSLIRFGFFVIVSFLLAEVRRAHTREAAFARTDALTGLANSRSFYEAVDRELSRCRRYKRSFSLTYIDLDDFKEVNDTAGHTAGDALLVAMAMALRQVVRDVDTAARLGGDEFAVLLPETDEQGATAAARKMHRALEATATQLGHRVGASIGVVTCPTPPRNRDELLHLADELMYSVKRGAKNAVACSVYVQEAAAAG